MSQPIDLSIIVVSWNVEKLLEGCIESILSNSEQLSLEILVIDNASADNTAEMLNNKFPNVRLIINKKNIGFARANNQALKFANGQFVLILNPDTVITAGALKRLVAFMIDHPEVGLVGPNIRYPNGEVQKSCARLLPTTVSMLLHDVLQIYKLPLIGRWLSKKYIFPYNYHVTQEVEAVSGAAMMLRREVIKALNGFGDTFLHCGEDIDLCFRVRSSGWKVFYFCDAVVVHFSGQSSRQIPVRTFVNTALSVQRYLDRCFGNRQAILYRFIVQSIQVPLMVAIGCAKFLLGLESVQEFKARLQIAKFIWLWRALE
jgi:GT2 family glycosyltransferase